MTVIVSTKVEIQGTGGMTATYQAEPNRVPDRATAYREIADWAAESFSPILGKITSITFTFTEES